MRGLFELNEQNAAAYLNKTAGLCAENWTVTALGGGVSNTVLLAEGEGRRLALKQSLAKLRVQEDWPADRTRIHREWLAMQRLAPHLPPGSVPEVLWVDPANCLFVMSAAPSGVRTWKADLLEGRADERVARRAAEMLGAMIRISWNSPKWEEAFGDIEAFEQLRLDPYYAFTASRHPDLASYLLGAAREARTRRRCLVHGDWSPKNFLVWEDNVMAIDWEAIHFGDPAFDAAFLLNHLLLKSLHLPHWAERFAKSAETFRTVLAGLLPDDPEEFESATRRHLGCLLLARIDGKSPVEYITDAEEKKRVRRIARRIIEHEPVSVTEIFAEAAR